MGDVVVIERPLYSTWEAARLVGVPPSTLTRWLDGGWSRGRYYEPVIRPRATGADGVTWSEFIEASLLRAYRSKEVPLQRMRPFIDGMRNEFGVPYPLAHFRPLISRKELVYRLQEETQLPDALVLVRGRGDQLVLADTVREFLETVDLDEQLLVVDRLWPLGKDAPVAIDPEVSFGIPQIRGIRTELIAESVEAGGIEEAEESWALTREEVDAALAFEKKQHRRAA